MIKSDSSNTINISHTIIIRCDGGSDKIIIEYGT
jgi:hypothetical protein